MKPRPGDVSTFPAKGDTMTTKFLGLLCVALLGCDAEDGVESGRVAIETNALGIVELTIDSSIEGAKHLVVMHGLDASGEVLGSVELTTGMIDFRYEDNSPIEVVPGADPKVAWLPAQARASYVVPDGFPTE